MGNIFQFTLTKWARWMWIIANFRIEIFAWQFVCRYLSRLSTSHINILAFGNVWLRLKSACPDRCPFLTSPISKWLLIVFDRLAILMHKHIPLTLYPIPHPFRCAIHYLSTERANQNSEINSIFRMLSKMKRILKQPHWNRFHTEQIQQINIAI